MSEVRPAFYALAPGGWRDFVTILHPPYTAWHLSYVAIGAALAPRFDGRLLGLLLASFFLGLGVAAHALDELHGRPLRTRLPDTTLAALAAVSLAAATAIGVAVAVERDLRLLAFVGAGCFVAVAYNLELFGGRLHGEPWFSLAWGAFPLLTAYFATAGSLRVGAVVAAAAAAALSHAQRLLSTPVRELRRRVDSVDGSIALADGTRRQLDAEALITPYEHALRALAVAVVLLAVALVVLRVT